MRLFKWSYSYMWWDHLFTVINQLSSILLSRLYILITALYIFSTTMSCNSPLANVVCFTCTTFNKVYLILSYMATKPTVFMLHTIELASASNWKSILRSRDGGALIHCIMCSLYKKTHQYLKQITFGFYYKSTFCQNAALPLNGLHFKITLSEYRTLCGPSRSGLGRHCIWEVATSF